MNVPAKALIANARMYSVSVAAAESWRELLSRVARRARQPVDFIDHAAPAPLAELWARADKAAVFMCGLPYSRSEPRPYLLAAPVPSPAQFGGQPVYWSEFVVRGDSDYHSLADTFGQRIAFTSIESQSGFAAPLMYLSQQGGRRPLFLEVIAPQVTPQGAVAAVAEGRAEVAAIDAYSLQLMRRYTPELAAQVRVVARTPSRPIPPLVASSVLPSLARALCEAHDDPVLQPVLADLRLSRFVQPDPQAYEPLRIEFETALDYWRTHALAMDVHPAFRGLTPSLGTE